MGIQLADDGAVESIRLAPLLEAVQARAEVKYHFEACCRALRTYRVGSRYVVLAVAHHVVHHSCHETPCATAARVHLAVVSSKEVK